MTLTNEEYRDLDRAALQIRIDYNLLNDRLDTDELASLFKIMLVPYSSLKQDALDFIEEKIDKLEDGFTVPINREDYLAIIFFNDKKCKARARFTICHEICHIIFGDNNDGELEEFRANHFARQLLIPTCLVMLYIFKKADIYDLQSKFDASYEVAMHAYDSALNRLYSRGNILEDYEIEFFRKILSKTLWS